jgi:hypothetical protein
MAEDEDDLLQQALAMSMAAASAEPDTDMSEAAAPQAGEGNPPQGGASMFDSYDEELQNALKMSMMEVQPGEEATQPAGEVHQVATLSLLRAAMSR